LVAEQGGVEHFADDAVQVEIGEPIGDEAFNVTSGLFALQASLQ
jgi:hypothetical protein